MDSIKLYGLSVIGLIGGAVADLFGGWTHGLTVLLSFMAVDWLTGLVVAGVFKKSKKTDSGALESRAGFKGLCRKGMMLLIVLVASQLDTLIGGEFVKDGVCIAFAVNEVISITENAGLMGVPIPKKITKAIEILKTKEED
jgi:toxin secretion/phage lysis holin